MKDYFYKFENDKVNFSGILKEINDSTIVLDDTNKRNSFQAMFVTHNGFNYNIRMNDYNNNFDKLTTDDQSIVYDKIMNFICNSRVDVEAESYRDYYGNAKIIIELNDKKMDLNTLIDNLIIKVLRKNNLKVDVKIVSIENFDKILVNYNGVFKKVKLDLLNTTASKLNRYEKQNLTEWVKKRIPHDSKVTLKIGGVCDNSWFAELIYNGYGLGNSNINREIYKILDYTPKVEKNIYFKFNALVSNIIDGDTLTIYKNGRRTKVRFDGIDSPEKDQNFGKQAKQYLRSLILDNELFITSKEVGYYNRLIAEVHVKDNVNKLISINEKMITSGFAHPINYKYRMIAEKDNVVEKKKGLWSNPFSRKITPKSYRDSKK